MNGHAALEELQAELIRYCGNHLATVSDVPQEVRTGEKLAAVLREAWEEAMSAQSAEIRRLRERLSPAKELSAQLAAAEQEVDIGKTWSLIQKETAFVDDEIKERDNERNIKFNNVVFRDVYQKSKSPALADSDEERRRLQREASADLFDYLQCLTPSMGALAKAELDSGQRSGERRELIERALPRSAWRLDLLEQHAAAGCVEYRFLAAALAAQPAFGEAAAAVVDEEEAAASWSAMAGRVLKATDYDGSIADSLDEGIEDSVTDEASLTSLTPVCAHVSPPILSRLSARCFHLVFFI